MAKVVEKANLKECLSTLIPQLQDPVQALLGSFGSFMATLLAVFHGQSPQEYNRLGARGAVARLFRGAIFHDKEALELDPNQISFSRIGATSAREVKEIFQIFLRQVTTVRISDGNDTFELPVARTKQEQGDLKERIRDLMDRNPALQIIGADTSGETNGFATAAIRGKNSLFGESLKIVPMPFLASRAWLLTVEELKRRNPGADISRQLINNSPGVLHYSVIPTTYHPETGEICLVAHIKPAKDIGGKQALGTLGGNCFAEALFQEDTFYSAVSTHLLQKTGIKLDSLSLSEISILVEEFGLGNRNVARVARPVAFETLSEILLEGYLKNCPEGITPSHIQGIILIPISSPPTYDSQLTPSGQEYAMGELAVYRFNGEGVESRLSCAHEPVELRPNLVAIIDALSEGRTRNALIKGID